MIDTSQLVGTGRMLSWKGEFADTGEVVDALGPDPIGYVSYGAGRVQVIVVRRDRQPPRNTPPPTAEEKMELFDSMLAYTGAYPPHEGHVIHHIDASWNRTWTGIERVRFVRLTGSTLEISGAPAPDPYTGRTVVHRIVFEKWAKQPK
jgi:hypothetical protein